MKSLNPQHHKILAVLEAVRNGTHDIPSEFLRRHPTGDGLSARYLKRVAGFTEVNGRISEMRALGVPIETSTQRDAYRFRYHRLKPEGMTLTPVAYAAEKCRRFDAGLPAQEVFAV